MIITVLKFLDPLIVFFFRLNDFCVSLISTSIFLFKKGILLIAFGSFFFLFLPEMRKDFGSMAETMLLFLLFLSPLSKIFRMKLLFLLMSMRREFGILMGCFASVHSLAYFVDPSSFVFIKPYLNSRFFSLQPIFFFGIMAFLFTLPLLLTSNTISVHLLGSKRWKLLHRIVYILLILMLLHIFFLKGFRQGSLNIFELLQTASILLSFLLLWIFALYGTPIFLRDVILYLDNRYKTFCTQEHKNI